MTSLQHIIQHLFQKDNINEIAVETLEQFAAEHPLFAPAQFLLAQKYKKTADPAFEKQIQKAVLHFHNPLWLHYQLNLNENGSHDIEFRIAKEDFKEYKVTEPPIESISHDLIEEVVVHQELETFVTPGIQEFDADTNVNDEGPAPSQIPTDDAPVITNTDFQASVPVQAIPGKEEPKALELPVEDNKPASNTRSVHPLFGKTGDSDNLEANITFEPFHTVDYFASQGIKISGEFKPEDRLGKQLKSFTEWLKTMRKLPEATVDAELGKINDTEIQEIAAHSLEEKEVLTEAMAEVLAKQGREEQALEVYRKLSLLNPDKSAYFAAKIEGLKHS